MDRLKIVLASVAVVALIGCGDNFGSEDSNSENISVDDILGISTENNDTSTDEETEETKATESTVTSSDSGTFETQSVGYTLNSSSLPVCYNTEDVRLDYADTKTYVCKWVCGIYEGDGPIQVELTFTKAERWSLTGEALSTASANCL